MNSEKNAVIVNVMHAMVGSITPNWRAVFLSVNGGITVTIVLTAESAHDRDEIGEVSFELEALQPESKLEVLVLVSSAPLETFTETGELIFARKE